MKKLNKKGKVEWDYMVYFILFLVAILISAILIFFAKDTIIELGELILGKIWIFD